MSDKTDRERAIFFEGKMHEEQEDAKWLREQLAEAHRIIGILVSSGGPASIVPSLGKHFPGLHPAKKTPGTIRKEEWEALVKGNQT